MRRRMSKRRLKLMEPVIWKGSPAFLGDMAVYGVAAAGALLLALLWWPLSLLALAAAIWQWQHTRSIRYHVTNKRVRIRSGIFIKRKQSVMLTKLCGYGLHYPRGLRRFGLSTVTISTDDQALPHLRLLHLREGASVMHTIRSLSMKREVMEAQSPMHKYVDHGH